MKRLLTNPKGYDPDNSAVREDLESREAEEVRGDRDARESQEVPDAREVEEAREDRDAKEVPEICHDGVFLVPENYYIDMT